MPQSLTLRTATAADAPHLLAIYAPYVLNTAITFEYTVPTEAEFAQRITRTLARYPYLVAEDASGHLLGYAYASAFKERAAYDWSVETSIYVRQDTHGQGVGKALYQALENALARQHIINVNACIAYPNPGSIAFHERLGYKTVAHFTRCGFKQGQWYDMIWMEKMLADHPAHPLPVIPFPQLEAR